jgi:multicomponent Na+:H+ antiporter subunit F
MVMRFLMLEFMQWFIVVCTVFCAARLVMGPSAADRLVALNVLSGLVLAFLVLRGVAEERALYLDVALVYDIFGFLGFLAVARFLKDKITEKGDG